MGTLARLNVKVVPGSSRNQIVGWLGESLKIKVTAPPEKGQANEAIVELLASTLDSTTDAIEIESGLSSPSKIVTIHGMDAEAINSSLGWSPTPPREQVVHRFDQPPPLDGNDRR